MSADLTDYFRVCIRVGLNTLEIDFTSARAQLLFKLRLPFQRVLFVAFSQRESRSDL